MHLSRKCRKNEEKWCVVNFWGNNSMKDGVLDRTLWPVKWKTCAAVVFATFLCGYSHFCPVISFFTYLPLSPDRAQISLLWTVLPLATHLRIAVFPSFPSYFCCFKCSSCSFGNSSLDDDDHHQLKKETSFLYMWPRWLGSSHFLDIRLHLY